MGRAEEMVPGFVAETELERRLAADPQLLAGLAWGEPRAGHPEGRVGAHVADLLAELERSAETGERRAQLRLITLVHDAFKYRVKNWLPKTGDNHHAARARAFASGYTEDERVLATIELHDRPYALWRKMRRKGRLDGSAFTRMIERVPDPELFMRFIELDASTEGKDQEPIRWLRSELERRGVLRPPRARERQSGGDA